MPHKLSSTHLINQGDTSIYYPGTSTSAFTDSNFYKKCGKTAAGGDIKQYGCAICALGMFILYKGGLSNTTKSNVYYAVVEATTKGTNNAADFTASGFTAKIGSQSIGVTITPIADVSVEAEKGSICMMRLKQGSNSHYVIVDGHNSSASNFDKYLVCDPDGGVQKTLTATMQKRGFSVSASVITERYKLS
ncbi:hypothetical protein [Paenibacillus silagei]|uniref:Peptidase C39-like domain-containing protein n=1 Tax=Paenibacillus silagei TaxID=1670801 RepID=A0ABS4NXX5_9BACL|nr:hypothetical protein [Paenibacillus silagei]MBP2114887.1 hypothetical protein [Paenibacillus silagei]